MAVRMTALSEPQMTYSLLIFSSLGFENEF